MTVTWAIDKVLSEYPGNLQPDTVLSLPARTGLSGLKHWRIDCPDGRYCLRCWSPRTPSCERLEYTQAVLWYAVYEGIDFVPLPLEAADRKGYVFLFDSYWELLPWIEGENDPSLFVPGYPPQKSAKNDGNSDSLSNVTNNSNVNGSTISAGSFDSSSSTNSSDMQSNSDLSSNAKRQLDALHAATAMIAIAQFHESTSTFPLPNEPQELSPAILRHAEFWKDEPENLDNIFNNYFRSPSCLSSESQLKRWTEQTGEFRELVGSLREHLTVLLEQLAIRKMSIQPSIGNAHRRHLLYNLGEFSGLIGFREMGADSVALDIASLLSSIAGGSDELWTLGLRSYNSIRPLDEAEQQAIVGLDLSGSIMTNLQFAKLLHSDITTHLPEQIDLILNEISKRNIHLATCQKRLLAA
ncbi:MAG: hypothetical protein LBU65_16450 [Planctomycetaceae bacterium]|jgi:hypothetical protein|nr:hypothetical protein [Planctomycetaceae bacterium]